MALFSAVVLAPLCAPRALSAETPDFASQAVLNCPEEKAEARPACEAEQKRREVTRLLTLAGPAHGNEALARLPTYPNLATLVVRGSRVNDAGVALIAAHRPLYYLDLGFTPISPASAYSLAGMQQMSMLDVAGTAIDDNFLAALKRPGMRYLNLSQTAVTAAGIEKVPALFPHLQRLDLMGLPFKDDHMMDLIGVANREAFTKLVSENRAGLLTGIFSKRKPLDAEVKGLAELEDLNLAGTNITDRSILMLSALRNVKLLDLSFNALTVEGLRDLERMPWLEALSINGTVMDDATLGSLPPRLRILAIEQTPVTDAGLQKIAKLPALEVVYLQKTKVTVAGLTALQKERPKLRIEHPESPARKK